MINDFNRLGAAFRSLSLEDRRYRKQSYGRVGARLRWVVYLRKFCTPYVRMTRGLKRVNLKAELVLNETERGRLAALTLRAVSM